MPALRFIHEDGQRYIDEYECRKSPGKTLRRWRHKHLASVSNPVRYGRVEIVLDKTMTRRQPRRPSSNSRCESSFSAASEASSSQVSTPSCDGSVDFVDGSYTSSPICDDYLSDSVWDSHSAVIPWTPANSSAGEPTPTIALNLCPAACKAHQNLNTEKNHDDIESLSFRATTISSLKHDLQDAASLANDEAIASVLNICAFEVLAGNNPSQGDQEIDVHFRGLEALVTRRGGIGAIQDDFSSHGLAEMIQIHDNLYAILNDRDLIFGGSYVSQSRPAMPSPESGLMFDGSPLWIPSAFSDDFSKQTEHLEGILGDRETAESLAEAAKVTRLTHDEHNLTPRCTSTNVAADKQQTLTERLRHYGELSSRQYVVSSSYSDEAEACRIALRIYLSAVMQLTPFAHPANHMNADLLYSVMARANLLSWERMPFIYQWVLLVGAVAATDKVQKRFFSIQLSKFDLQHGLRNWNTYNQNVANFLWLQWLLRSTQQTNTS